MKEKIENQEIKDYLINLATNRLQNCDVFTRTFGKKFAEKRLKTNLCKVYTNEVNKKCRGYAITQGKGASTITICCETEMNELLSVEQVTEDAGFESTALHEAIHIILEKTKRECKKTFIVSGTGIHEQFDKGEIGRGLNEGLTNWIVRKTGLFTNSYQTLTNFMEELELAIGEDNVMAMGKGNLAKRIPELLKIDFDECLRIFAISDEIYKVNEQIQNDRIIVDITQRFLMRDELDSEDREEAETEYKELLQTGIKEEYYIEEHEYQKSLREESKFDTLENRRDYFKNQLQKNVSRRLELKSQFESIIYEKYFKNEFEQYMTSGKEPNLQQLRKWDDLWNLITEEGVQEETPISEFKEKYEEMIKKYLDNISLEAEEKLKNGKLSGKELAELLKKSSGLGNEYVNIRLLSTVAQLIAPNSRSALYVQELLESLDFEDIENINKYKMSISTYCAGDINIPVYTKNGKIESGFSKSFEVEFVEMKIKSEKELKDENVEIFDYTTDLEEDGYTTAREEALQIYQEALKKDSSTTMKILDRMIVLENEEGIQNPYIISAGHVLPAFAQKDSIINIKLAPNMVEFPAVQSENMFSRFIARIKSRISKSNNFLKEEMCYNSKINEKSKNFRESMRLEEGGQENTEANDYVIKKNAIEILGKNQEKDNGLPR